MSRPRKAFVLVAGINGAGKSTFVQSRAAIEDFAGELGGEYEVINPDLVTREIRDQDPSIPIGRANLQAANACELRIHKLLDARKSSFAIETVLSTDKYKPIVQKALKNGYDVYFFYILLGSVDEAIARVRLRVKRKGHNVPTAKIRKRWPRSLRNVPWYWEHSTQAFVFFNGSSVPEPLLLAARSRNQTSFNPETLLPLLA